MLLQTAAHLDVPVTMLLQAWHDFGARRRHPSPSAAVPNGPSNQTHNDGQVRPLP